MYRISQAFLVAFVAFLSSPLLPVIRGAEAYKPVVSDPFELSWAWSEIEDLEGVADLRCIEVDGRGRVWLGYEDEVARYDGESLRFYPEIQSRGTRSIFAASDGYLYITDYKRLWRGDGERWKRYEPFLDIPSPSDMGVREGPDGRLWIASDSSLYLVGADSLEFKARVAEGPITDFDIDEEGRFWILESPSGTVRSLRLEGELVVADGLWPELMALPSPTAGVSQHVVSDIFCAADGSVWLANANGRLAPLELRSGSKMWIAHDLASLGGTSFNGSISRTSDGVLRITGAGTIHRFEGGGSGAYTAVLPCVCLAAGPMSRRLQMARFGFSSAF